MQDTKNTYNLFEALTPLDGRNRRKLTQLIPYFTDFALNKYRMLVEIKYFIKLSEIGVIRKLDKSELKILDELINNFCENDYLEIIKIESKVNHDVKALELFIQKQLKNTSLKDVSEMIHFGVTSDDTNNIAYALMIKGALEETLIPEIKNLQKLLLEKSQLYKHIPMMGRTHGQDAIPTTVGKEIFVYYKRLTQEINILKNLKIQAKLTGNVGNLNLHYALLSKFDWLEFSKNFIKSLDLEPDIITTQIEPYDRLNQIFCSLMGINNILIGFCKDMWMYISNSYFKQEVIKSEVGSSALPHKVNPIYFEGAEGGFGVANALFEFYIRKLSYSRLQRDLSDSTVRRSFSIPFSYSLLSYQSVVEALKRIEPNVEQLEEDLDKNWQILSEVVQNLLRLRGYENAYDTAKNFFRGNQISQTEYTKFVQSLEISDTDKNTLVNLNPKSYTGYAEKLVDVSKL